MDHPSFDLFVSVNGKRQGHFKGGSTEKGYEGTIEALALTYDVSSPVSAGTGMATAKVQHSPVTIVKEWDTASTQLFSALTSNESLDTVVLTFVPASSATGHPLNRGTSHSITLKQALVSKIALRRDSPAPGVRGDSHDLEEVSFVFQQIELSDLKGGTAAAYGATSTASLASTPGTAAVAGSPYSRLEPVGPALQRAVAEQPLHLRGM